MSDKRNSLRDLIGEHEREARSTLRQLDHDAAQEAKRLERMEQARRKEANVFSPEGTTGTATLARVFGLPIAAFVVFMAAGSGQAVAKTATPILIGLLIAIYFLPTIEAVLRKHHSLTSIVLVNFFFGWTLIGWVVAIAWACAGSDKGLEGKRPAERPQQQPSLAVTPGPQVPTAEKQSTEYVAAVPALSVADEVRKLAELRDQKILTEEEFQMQKEKALNR